MCYRTSRPLKPAQGGEREWTHHLHRNRVSPRLRISSATKSLDGVRVEREPMGAFETVLALWLCHLINSFAANRKLGLAVNEVLFVLNASRDLKRRPDVAYVP
jgi:hypothetical protein